MKRTAPLLKYFISTFVIVSLIGALFNKLAASFFSGYGITTLLGVSSSFWDNYFFWQPFTYFLIEPSFDGLSFSFLFSLFFDAYVIWMIGSSIINIVGEKSFFRLVFVTGLVTGLAGYGLLTLFGSKSLIIGPQSFIYALLIVWLSFNPVAELFLLFAIKFKARTIVFVLIGIGVLSLISEGRYIDFFVVLSGIMTGYFYSTIVYSLKSPFNFLNIIDKALIHFGKLSRKLLRGGKQEVVHGKIIDIRSIKQ